eukprot:COSAG06_NODE_192_length_20674_cov_7.209186_5_plen_102_part_00
MFRHNLSRAVAPRAPHPTGPRPFAFRVEAGKAGQEAAGSADRSVRRLWRSVVVGRGWRASRGPCHVRQHDLRGATWEKHKAQRGGSVRALEKASTVTPRAR